jgi:hypothetical protein
MSEPDGVAESDPTPTAAPRSAQGRRPNLTDDQPFLHPPLPPYLIQGNRFASAGLACALVGLAMALVDGWPFVGWISALMGVVLACAGFVKYCRGSASNRDSAVLGGVIAWIAVVVLLARASIALGIPMSPPPP